MQPLYIFRHIECEGPGYLAEVLKRKNIPWQLIAVDAGKSVPDSIDGCSGLVFMGGPMSVNDDLPWIGQELALIRSAQASGIPVLGHCLGGQLICKALGGEITTNPVKEIGWHNVQQVPSEISSNWLSGLPNWFTAFHWHGEAFSLPEGATPLLTNQYCNHQAFALGNTLALQCHIEMTADMVREWVDLYADELQNPTESVQGAKMITDNAKQRCHELQQSADTLYKRWLQRLKQ